MLGRLERILRLAGKHYITSLALWLFTAPFMIVGLLFQELQGPWSMSNVGSVLVTGAAAHLALGSVLIAARYLVFPVVGDNRHFAWYVGATLVIAGALRGFVLGTVAEATGVGELALALRLPTSITLVAFSFSLAAYSLQLWESYRKKRQELLLSLVETGVDSNKHKTFTSDSPWASVRDANYSVEAARAQTLQSLSAIRRAIEAGELGTAPVRGVLDSADSAWRATSHEVWERGRPNIPQITPAELLRTWSASKPFSALVLALGPLYGLARTLDTATNVERWTLFGAWLLGALAIGMLANTLAERARSLAPLVLVVALLGIQALPVLLGNMISGDFSLLLSLWFVGFVSSAFSLVFGFPPALERQGQKVIDQLEKWIDQATLQTLRVHGEQFIASRRLAHYLHAEIRGHLLIMSMSLRSAIDFKDKGEALRAVDDLHTLVTELAPNARSATPQDNLQEFLGNWARMINLTHNLDSLSLPPLVAIATEAIVMEAVNDSVRHACSSQVDVLISPVDDGYQVMVTSDGQAPQSAFSPGLGTRILNTYAPGRWSREVLSDGLYCLVVQLLDDAHVATP